MTSLIIVDYNDVKNIQRGRKNKYIGKKIRFEKLNSFLLLVGLQGLQIKNRGYNDREGNDKTYNPF